MVQCGTVFLCVMGLLSETLCSLPLEAEAGDNVTIWCQHELTITGPIFWYKHTCGSVPLLLGCKRFFASAPSESCTSFTESERIVMSVHGKNTSLTITAVNGSDTGLYYCSFMKQVMSFGISTSLHVKDGNKTNKNTETEEGLSVSRSSGSVPNTVFFMLIVVVIVILLGVLIFILKHRKNHKGAEAEDNEFSEKKRKRRRDETEYSYVVYSSVSQ